jgi:hypothetical protein
MEALMPDNPMQAASQPYVKLVQSNMELLKKYSMSPEDMAKAMSNAQSMLTPGQGVTVDPAQSQVLAELAQGMIKNYTEFMAEVAKRGVEMLAQGQAALIQKTQQAAEQVAGAAEVAETRSRRGR